MERESLRIKTQKILFHNESNGYTVARVKSGRKETFTAAGVFINPHEGQELDAEGEWTVHPRYGRQFKVITTQPVQPASKKAVEKYLSSGLIRGVGKSMAKKIADTLGENALDALKENPGLIYTVKGIGEKSAAVILESLAQQREIEKIMLFLKEYDISNALAAKIFKQYGTESILRIRENPYCLADDIKGVGFVTADRIAENMGYAKDSPQRIRCGIEWVLQQLTETGDVYAEEETLLEEAGKLLGVDADLLKAGIGDAVEKHTVFKDGGRIYTSLLYHCEKGVALRLIRILNDSESFGKKKAIKVNAEQLRNLTGLTYNELQLKAVMTAAQEHVTVITGGPGTGKTTTVKGILSVFRNKCLKILLAAPTGRAAKRLSETTGLEARTIHRLLEYNFETGFGRDKDNPLEGDALIVDECSMIDISLMNSLLKAVPPGMRVILIGDMDQLPSVGPGNVLRDIIESERVPTIRLTEIFRQALGSDIVRNAHLINRGERPLLDNRRDDDFFFIEIADTASIRDTIADLVTRRIPDFNGTNPSDVLVLSPMRKGIVGTEELNRLLQERINPDGPQINRGPVTLRLGDRVMQTRNDYEHDVFNGDIGVITDINQEERSIDCLFDGKQVTYKGSQLEDIDLAYATTIHKAQGQEAGTVVIPMTRSHYVMLQRNLIYTAVTRAKKLCILVGEKSALAMAVANNGITTRNTYLRQRLNPLLPQEPGEEDTEQTADSGN